MAIINNKIMQKTHKIYEGKAKIIYATENPELLIQYFKDSATAFNGIKKAEIIGKGELNNTISAYIMQILAKNNIATHFIEKINNKEQLIKKVNIIPLEVIIRNTVAGSLAKKLNLTEGLDLPHPIFEICYKNDALGDPLINEDQAVYALQLISKQNLATIKNIALQINSILQKIFININIKLVDFKIEFGYDLQQKIILADEISPDSCRLWDLNTAKKLDKDIFRQDLGSLIDGYQEIINRFFKK
jgi:phosphoribosylaminoimidazole-succinocarboxamide synthase